MPTITASRTIAAPQERVFELFTDLANAPSRIKGITRLEVLTGGPVGKGTRFRETRKMFGKEATETMEITDFNWPTSYTVGATSCGTSYSTVLTFTPQGNATRVEMRFQARPLTFFAKLLAPLMRLMAGFMRKCLEADLADLQRAAESVA